MQTRLISALVVLASAVTASAQEGRKEIILDAAQLAPGLTAEKPSPGKWWLRRDVKDWGARGGNILLVGQITGQKGSGGEWKVTPADRFVHYQVPEIVIDPKALGWYRIHVGLLHEPVDPHARLLARLSDEPYPEYLQTPENTSKQTTEVYWKAADLTGKKLHLGPTPGPMPHPGYFLPGGITHVRLVPMNAQEVQEAKREIELPPPQGRLFGMLDYTDEVFWWSTVETPEDIKAIVYRHLQAGFGRIYWRSWGSHLDHTLALPEAAPRWTGEDEKRWCKQQNTRAGWLPYINLTKRFDPLKVAVDYGQAHDCEVHAWVRFTNLNREPYANFWHDHRHLCAQMLARAKDLKTGKLEPIKPYKRSPYSRVLSMAYPEVRAFYLKFFKQIAATGTRGILIDLLRHPPIAGYEPIVADAFRKKYGMDMETRDVYHDPLVQEHLSEYLRLFLVDLRQELGKDIEIGVRCSGPSKYALRGKEWVAAGLIDTIIDGNWYSGNGPRPTIGETVAAVGKRGQAFAIVDVANVDPAKNWQRLPGSLSPQAIAAFAKHYSGKGVARMGLYESTIYTWTPAYRRAIRQAGWDYDPRKMEGKK